MFDVLPDWKSKLNKTARVSINAGIGLSVQ
jgi:hypothetical protein